MDIQTIKQRFGITGHSILLDRAIDIARQVAATDLSVLITGESGTGKEVFPKIIHQLSARKHGQYIAVNCGAIPEGTIDSELFGHEKGSFTGAHEARKGYFEVADGGTIFLDEVAELPVQTQVRLLRVLETGEFIKVGSSKVLKTNVRITAATNVDLHDAISKGRFRQDLYYRLNTVPILMPALRERENDIILLFRKFASDFAEKYRMPALSLDESAQKHLLSFRWPGNIRQLKNVTEQISVIEQNRQITSEVLSKYLHDATPQLPVLFHPKEQFNSEHTERDILYKVLFDMRNDITELKRTVYDLLHNQDVAYHDDFLKANASILAKHDIEKPTSLAPLERPTFNISTKEHEFHSHDEVIEESLSLQDKEKDMIKRAIDKHKGRRKNAADELGISERTLYRKIKEYNIKA